MKTKLVLSLVALLLSAYASAGAAPNPADYTISVHVTRSRSVGLDGRLNVVIDGKKYELQAGAIPQGLLALGDYKAKIVRDEHKESYYSIREYEFLFPGNKTRRFTVVGETE
jgi:hypothetical protein